jgi:hypothetical protein
VEKSSPNIWAASVTFKKLPKVSNCPTGENSPNLVTLDDTIGDILWHGYSSKNRLTKLQFFSLSKYK